MKLIIDIPDHLYNVIRNKECTNKNVLTKAVENATPLDDIKAEFINSYPKNWAGEPELGGASCHFSLNKVLKILDSVGKEARNDYVL